MHSGLSRLGPRDSLLTQRDATMFAIRAPAEYHLSRKAAMSSIRIVAITVARHVLSNRKASKHHGLSAPEVPWSHVDGC
jgi:hypothetical protein